MPLRMAASSPEQMSNKRRLFTPLPPLQTVDFGVDGQFGEIRVHWWIVIGVPQFAMNFAVPSCGFVSPSTEILPYNRYCRYSIPYPYRKFPSFTRFERSSVEFLWVVLEVVRSKWLCWTERKSVGLSRREDPASHNSVVERPVSGGCQFTFCVSLD